jgi:hypothetical protein
MLIITNKPEFLYDNNDNIKSLNYLNYKMKIGFEDYNEYINLPFFTLLVAIISYYLSKYFI